MTISATYQVRRAFRVPKDGGMRKPYRYYEAGVQLTDEDIKVWGEDGSIADLLASGDVEQNIQPVSKEPEKKVPDAVGALAKARDALSAAVTAEEAAEEATVKTSV